mmetsp:Transcript_86449/g.249695  ORF Transcript_86449/g.249695 Transcript_86449/m.249695 type:complete len:295 (+) Transcript_86449:1328-2212(+)
MLCLSSLALTQIQGLGPAISHNPMRQITDLQLRRLKVHTEVVATQLCPRALAVTWALDALRILSEKAILAKETSTTVLCHRALEAMSGQADLPISLARMATLSMALARRTTSDHRRVAKAPMAALALLPMVLKVSVKMVTAITSIPAPAVLGKIAMALEAIPMDSAKVVVTAAQPKIMTASEATQKALAKTMTMDSDPLQTDLAKTAMVLVGTQTDSAKATAIALDPALDRMAATALEVMPMVPHKDSAQEATVTVSALVPMAPVRTTSATTPTVSIKTTTTAAPQMALVKTTI